MPRDAQDTPDGGKQPRLSKFIGKIADIEAADLTDQQLRAARKLAAKRGIAASSDLDAVQQLKALVARGKTGAGKRSKATTQESASVQGYLSSRAAMLELVRTQGFKASLADPDIDLIQRLPTEASNEDAYRRYAERVRIGFDPHDNVVKMEVIAPEPRQALRYANALIGLAEAQVDHMSQRLRADRMRGAHASHKAAEARLAEAQAKVLRLQQQRGVLSADLEASTQMAQIAALQSALLEKRLQLAEMGDNARPNATRSDVLENSITRLEAMIGELRGGLTAGDAASASLARVGAELLAAQGELDLHREMLSQSVQLLEAARIEANRQSIYLATSVAPVLPDEAAYPKALQNSALAFLILSGVNLMLSLSFSVLREQISA